MTNKTTAPIDSKKQSEIAHSRMMRDGTEEQNLDDLGNPAARIRKTDVNAAFAKQRPKE
jgi:hypothetical protein